MLFASVFKPKPIGAMTAAVIFCQAMLLRDEVAKVLAADCVVRPELCALDNEPTAVKFFVTRFFVAGLAPEAAVNDGFSCCMRTMRFEEFVEGLRLRRRLIQKYLSNSARRDVFGFPFNRGSCLIEIPVEDIHLHSAHPCAESLHMQQRFVF